MTTPTKQAYTEAYVNAPQYVKDFIQSDELADVFEVIRTTYKLHLDDAGTLADLLNAVVLELMPLGQFEAALAEYIPNLDAETRARVARDANDTIFAVLRSRVATPAPAAPAPQASIVAQKLTTPTSEILKEVTAPMPQRESDNQELITGNWPPTTNPRYSSGADPYREPVE
jgi:hypothetical protein